MDGDWGDWLHPGSRKAVVLALRSADAKRGADGGTAGCVIRWFHGELG